jgi:hypothetical protein
MIIPIDGRTAVQALCCAILLCTARAETLVKLDASTLPLGPCSVWSNTGSLGGNFVAEFDVPSVTTIAGIKGVTFDGSNDWYVGPVAPSSVTGNGSRTVAAWIYNPSIATEETIASWGRRGGGNGTSAGYTHGTHHIWGAAGQWGDVADVSWQGKAKAGTWTFVAITYDGAKLTTATYTDGLPGVTELNGPLNTWTTSTSGAALPFIVGCQNDANGTRNAGGIPASLSIAKLEIHDRALNPTEIAAAFNTNASTFGLAQVAVAPTIESFTASQPSTYSGTPVTLSWSVFGATDVSIDHGVTIPAGQTSVDVSPAETTTYTLTATNGSGSVTRNVAVIVKSGSPTALDQTLTIPQDTPTPVTLQGNDPNTPPAGWTWAIVAPPANGVLSGTAPALTYTPDTGFTGTDSFTFRIHDGIGDSNTATVTMRVNPPPTAPSAVALDASLLPSSAVAGSMAGLLQTTDPNFGETHSYQLVAGAGDTHNAWFTISGNQLVFQSNAAGHAGTDLSVRVRATDSTGRSFDQIITLPVVSIPGNVVVNEIHYNPANNTRTEFVELHNPTGSPVDISGWQFTDGISFSFPPGSSIAAGGHAVVAMDPDAFLTEFGRTAYGPYTGGLSSDGENLELRNAAGLLVDEVEYRSEFPWPVGAGGNGPSMELIHPSLDNNLGGSWRISQAGAGLSETDYVPAGSSGWFYRPGTSLPPSTWRDPSFAQDATWLAATTPIGFGGVNGVTIATTVPGMLNNYASVFARRTFNIATGEIPNGLLLRYTIDDGIIIWINGTEILRRNVSGTAQDPALNTTATFSGTEGLWYDVPLANAATFLREGVNVIAVRAFNRASNNSDFAFDVRLVRQAAAAVQRPTPGLANSSRVSNPPPQIRQVDHSPKQPKSGEPIRITAKVSDPQGVAQVRTLYQIVAPGQYIPARFPRTAAQILADPYGERPVNPAFENPANWTTLTMVDNGSNGDAVAADGVFTAVIPAQAHRTLVRYRISADDLPGATVRVPYPDDASLNFACFVYDGVPDYVASSASVTGNPGTVWPKELLTSLPVYHWIIRNEDMLTLNAYNGSEQMPNTGDDTVLAARRAEDWEGAFVYDGIVYDHVRTRLRGGNSRYGDNEGRFTRGKRHYKFQFNDGHRFQARDLSGKAYPQKWSSLAVNKMFGNKGGNGWGMPEEIGAKLWKTFEVPAPNTHWFHFRVIDGANEAPDQYNGDFWGIQQAVEEYEGTFLETRGMAKGNLYKMSDWIWDSERQRRYQSPDMVRDGSEFNNIRDNLHGGQTAAWLQQYNNYEKWYRYSAVAEAIRHYDLFPYTDDLRHALKNIAWYFEPTGSDPTRGVCWWLPYDWDASFGPNWNNGWEHANNALYGWDMSTSDGMPYVDKPAMKLEHRNVLREFRDLIWQEDQINRLIDDRAAVIAEISKADQDRWRNAPQASGTANDDPLEAKTADMKRFCFEGWYRDNGNIGPSVPNGRDAYLDTRADAADTGLLPAKPVISYTGAPNHPTNGLSFLTSAFADPQGAGTFGGMAWRIGEIEDTSAPAYDPKDDFIMEYTPVWESGVLTTFSNQVAIPAGALKPGHTYRARVRMKDSSGRWSHWSAPYQFTTTAPDDLNTLKQNLMITEVMYNPPGPAPATGSKEDYEYIELQNISATLTLDLGNVEFTEGIFFNFAGSAITSLAPGGHVLVVKNLAAFESRYGNGKPIAGVWDPAQNLANNGERIKLAYAGDLAIHDFTYDDAAPWPTTADGGGSAMVLNDPASAPDHSLAASWTGAPPTPGGATAPADPFGDWLAGQGGTGPMAEFRPGMTYLMSYAIGADLAASPQAALPVAGYRNDAAGTHLTLSFRKRSDATQIDYIVETSTDLGSWQSGPGLIETVGAPIDNGDGTETLTVQVAATIEEHPVRFIRLKVALAD